MALKMSYIELGVLLRSLLEVGILDLGGIETARGSAEKRLAGQSPASCQSSDRRHGCSKSNVDREERERLVTEVVGES